jgi:hypothetical protein
LRQLEWNVLKITEDTNKLYDRIVAKGGRDKLTVTREKIIEARGWQPSIYLTKDNFGRALSELGCYYVPKIMQPGPTFVFPVIDIDHKRQYARQSRWKAVFCAARANIVLSGASPCRDPYSSSCNLRHETGPKASCKFLGRTVIG